MSEKQKKRQWHTPTERIMMTGFGVVIILGTLLFVSAGFIGQWKGRILA